ncbi:hypothetical protein D3C75_971560 [compost metagenome]
MTSPTTLAHLRAAACGFSRIWCMAYMMRLCTGLKPSRTSGSARLVIVDRA